LTCDFWAENKGKKYKDNGIRRFDGSSTSTFVAGLQPSEIKGQEYLGLRPRLLYIAPLALRMRPFKAKYWPGRFLKSNPSQEREGWGNRALEQARRLA
jgi:hypothetical protein